MSPGLRRTVVAARDAIAEEIHAAGGDTDPDVASNPTLVRHRQIRDRLTREIDRVDLSLTGEDADALSDWIAYLDAGPTDFEAAAPARADRLRAIGRRLVRATTR